MKRINLIPPEYAVGKKALVETGLYRKAVLLGVLALAALVLHYGMMWRQVRLLKIDVLQIKQEAADAESSAESVKQSRSTLEAQLENLKQRQSLLARKRSELVKLKGGETKWSDILGAFHESVPDQVWIDQLKLSSEESGVVGGTFSNQKVGTFIQKLNGSDYFKNATFTKTEAGTLNERAVVFFELNFDLEV